MVCVHSWRWVLERRPKTTLNVFLVRWGWWWRPPILALVSSMNICWSTGMSSISVCTLTVYLIIVKLKIWCSILLAIAESDLLRVRRRLHAVHGAIFAAGICRIARWIAGAPTA